MYIDNTLFVKEDSFISHYKFNRLVKSLPVYASTFISFNTEDNSLHGHAIEITRNVGCFFDEVLDLIYEYTNYKVVYTQLDLDQTYEQVLRNKYFKSFIGKRQIILKESDLEYEKD